jgi:cytochrome c peroxidase
VSRAYANIGKAVAAYERLIMPGPSPFDAYVAALLENEAAVAEEALTPDQIAGLRLFIGDADCTRCHNGPLFTNNEFHNTGVPAAVGLPLDKGRKVGVQKVQADGFNCLGSFSDAGPEDCADLRFVKSSGSELVAAFKTPTLRNVAETAPYMHAGQFATLKEVLNHYNRAVSGTVGHTELEPLDLSETELAQLEAFLHSLSGPLAVAPEWLRPPQ